MAGGNRAAEAKAVWFRFVRRKLERKVTFKLLIGMRAGARKRYKFGSRKVYFQTIDWYACRSAQGV